MNTLSPEVLKALYELQVAVKNKGGELEIIRISTTEHTTDDFVQITQAGRVLVEFVP